MAVARVRRPSMFLILTAFTVPTGVGCGGAPRELASALPTVDEAVATSTTEAPKSAAGRSFGSPSLFLTAAGALTLDDVPLHSPEELAKLLPERIALWQQEHRSVAIDPREHGVVLRADRAASRLRFVETLQLCARAGFRKARLLTKLEDGPHAVQRVFPLYLMRSGTITLGKPAGAPAEADLALPPSRITLRMASADAERGRSGGGFVVESGMGATSSFAGEDRAKLRALLEKLRKETRASAEHDEIWIEGEADLKLAALLEAVDLARAVGFARIVLFDGNLQKDPDLIHQDIGLDPDLKTNYDLKRLGDVGVPGVPNVPHQPPGTVPPSSSDP